MKRFELESLSEYTDAAVLDEIRRVAQLHSDGPLTVAAFKRLSPKVSPNTVLRRFGNWKTALQKAGLEHLAKERFPTPYEQRLKRGRVMTDDELIDELRRVHQLVGFGVLTKKDFDNSSVTCGDLVSERIGGWHQALEKAGIGKSPAGKRYTDKECFENLAVVWSHYGRQPRFCEINETPSSVGSKAYILRWGNWRRALKAFVDWANADNSETVQAPVADQAKSRSEADTPPKRFGSAEDRHEIPLRLKWRVHVRDRFRCLACGRSPSEYGVTLHVDHIDPWATGGRTVLENLQTLCQDCNLAKGKSFADARGEPLK